MFRHVVLFSWVEGLTGAQQQSIADELGKLPGAIESIRDYRFGPDAGLNPANHDFVVVADFDDADGYLAYRDHPVHRALVEKCITPVAAARSAIQYEY
jgi:hypothetical protein